MYIFGTQIIRCPVVTKCFAFPIGNIITIPSCCFVQFRFILSFVRCVRVTLSAIGMQGRARERERDRDAGGGCTHTSHIQIKYSWRCTVDIYFAIIQIIFYFRLGIQNDRILLYVMRRCAMRGIEWRCDHRARGKINLLQLLPRITSNTICTFMPIWSWTKERNRRGGGGHKTKNNTETISICGAVALHINYNECASCFLETKNENN